MSSDDLRFLTENELKVLRGHRIDASWCNPELLMTKAAKEIDSLTRRLGLAIQTLTYLKLEECESTLDGTHHPQCFPCICRKSLERIEK